MTNPVTKIRYLDPTIIPAQPGYNTAILGVDNLSEDTKVEDVWVVYTPVIAWSIHPDLNDMLTGSELRNVTVHQINTDGINHSDDAYLVDPNGRWSQPYVQQFDSEDEAKKHFIESALFKLRHQ